MKSEMPKAEVPIADGRWPKNISRQKSMEWRMEAFPTRYVLRSRLAYCLLSLLVADRFGKDCLKLEPGTSLMYDV